MATAPDPPIPNPPPPAAPCATARYRRWTLLALVVLGAAGAAGWRYRVTRPAYRLARGEEAVKAGEWERAGYYVERLRAAGRPDEAHLLRGELLLARKRPEAALEEFDAVRADGPLRARAAVGLGRCFLDLGSPAEAHRAFSFVVDQEPGNVDAHRGLAAAAYDLGQFGLAVEHLEAVARLDPADARPHRLIGLIYKDMGQHEQAEAAYREALRRGPAAPVAREVRRELAESLLELGRFADALAALGDQPDEDAATAAARVAALRGAGRREEAVEVLDRSLERFPAAAPLYRLRGQLALDAGEHAAAIPPLEKAVELAPTDYRARYLLGQAYSGARREADAKREAARAEELRRDLDKITALSRRAMDRPWDPDVRLELAELSEKLGMPEVARTWRAAAAACRGRPR